MSIFKSEQGGIMIAVLMIIVVLTLSSVFLINTSISENKTVRNLRTYKSSFYKSDSGLSFLRKSETSWIKSSDFFDPSEDDPVIINNLSVELADNSVIDFCKYKIAKIQSNQEDNSKEFYSLSHIAPPPSGSGTSVKKIQVRRFGIETTASDEVWKGSVTVNAGVQKYFPKAD
ncbi:MAG: pilus assembly PilX N-terminal domain-containing protein [Nanobdellota archaeon]